MPSNPSGEPRTAWAFLPAWPAAGIVARAIGGRGGSIVAEHERPDDDLQALIGSIESSIRLGHHRVAARRYLMVLQTGGSLPQSLVEQCESALAKMSTRDREGAARAARAWAAMTSRRGHVHAS